MAGGPTDAGVDLTAAPLSLPVQPSGESIRLWLKIGCLGFGGPAGQIALMHRLVIDEKHWIDAEARFLHALNFCMLLPGPEAQQLATYLGWLDARPPRRAHRRHPVHRAGSVGDDGAQRLYVLYHQAPLVEGLFYGIRCAVVAIVVEALLRISRRALRRLIHAVIAAASFAAIFFSPCRFPWLSSPRGWQAD